jgi:hypothetical protein
MRLPDSGSILGSILDGLGRLPTDGTGVSIAAVTEAQLMGAIDAMVRGDIEYVILEDDDEFLQAAGDGDGPYALQFSSASSGGLLEVAGGVNVATLRSVFAAYRSGDRTCRDRFRWSPV